MPASPRQSKSASARRRQALSLRLAGVDLATIADKVGYADGSAAKTAIDRALQDSIARDEASIDDLRRTALLRYDRLQTAFWGPAMKGDIKAAKIVLDVMAQRARLQGTDAPTKINLDAKRLGDEILSLIGGADDDREPSS
ncbi:hypothetical protein OG896_24635 [Streptomyces sp. NBC_00669]|uniref:hypothetical protein n=1 Tax=Streptomyces sp. NBC_00669 TaxID=2976011 RepID=UPI002E3526BA|nr:hypothetical protein [Streptomyces sp. NBC_00669]